MGEEKKHEVKSKEYSVGYRIGEAFAIFLAICLMVIIGALTVGCVVRFFQWLF